MAQPELVRARPARCARFYDLALMLAQAEADSENEMDARTMLKAHFEVCEACRGWWNDMWEKSGPNPDGVA